MTTTDRPETESEVATTDAKFWLAEIEAAKERMKPWWDKAEAAEDRYKDCEERDFGQLNIFWANVETQKAAIGEEFGAPQVTRINQPENDGGLSRHIAEVWERAISASVRETDDNHDISLAVGDTFVPGRGQVWIELEADEDYAEAEGAGDDGGADDAEGYGEQPTAKTAKPAKPPMWACCTMPRVPYRDFLTGYATRWKAVPWVARGHLFTKDDLIQQCKLEPEEADQVPLNHSAQGDKEKRRAKKGQEQFRRARVWEIWTKFPLKARIYVAEDYENILCVDPDPYRLKGFFPCPRPLLANGDEGWNEPITDYSRYEDQARELDQISTRIYVLTDVLRRRGIYDKSFSQLADLAEAEDNVFIAVDNWVDLQAKGGLAKAFEVEDLTPTITVLAQLHSQRQELIALIYELSGISDLARGMTDPQETLGAQKLKMSFGSGRFQKREWDSRRFAAEAYQIKGEVIAEHFPREQLAEMSGIPLPTRKEIAAAKKQLGQIQAMVQASQAAQQQLAQLQASVQQPPQPGQPPALPPAPEQIAQLKAQAQMPPPNEEQIRYLTGIAQTKFAWEQIEKVLRSDYRRCYAVEVETDQSQFIDEESDKQRRTEFFSVVMSSFEKVAPLIGGNPKVGEVWKQIIMFVIGAFKAGRSQEEGLERVIDEAIQMAVQQAGQQQGQTDPMVEKQGKLLDLQIQSAAFELEGKKATQQKLAIADKQAETAALKAAGEETRKQAELEAKAQLDRDKFEHQRELDAAQAEAKARELEQKDRELDIRQEQVDVQYLVATKPVPEPAANDNAAGGGTEGGEPQQGRQQSQEWADIASLIDERTVALMEHSQAIMAHSLAPRQFHYGDNGEIAGVSVGDQHYNVNRHPDGAIHSVVPAELQPSEQAQGHV